MDCFGLNLVMVNWPQYLIGGWRPLGEVIGECVLGASGEGFMEHRRVDPVQPAPPVAIPGSSEGCT